MNTEFAIHTRTASEWDQVRDQLGIKFSNPSTRWDIYRGQSVIYHDSHSFSSLEWAVEHEYVIIPACSWLVASEDERLQLSISIANQNKKPVKKPLHDPLTRYISSRLGMNENLVCMIECLLLFFGVLFFLHYLHLT